MSEERVTKATIEGWERSVTANDAVHVLNFIKTDSGGTPGKAVPDFEIREGLIIMYRLLAERDDLRAELDRSWKREANLKEHQTDA